MYKLRWHKDLATRWDKFPRSKQILMIANELQRAGNFAIKEDHIEAKYALERAFELLDLTISCSRTGSQRYELLRFREMLGHTYLHEFNNSHLIAQLFNVLVSLDKESFNALH